MKESGYRSGFACLFYGDPGTGKTETVYQLARQTGRSILAVHVPEIKSKWVGDSEKNIKAVFDRYRLLVERSEIAPILLFNEADASLGSGWMGRKMPSTRWRTASRTSSWRRWSPWTGS